MLTFLPKTSTFLVPRWCLGQLRLELLFLNHCGSEMDLKEETTEQLSHEAPSDTRRHVLIAEQDD